MFEKIKTAFLWARAAIAWYIAYWVLLRIPYLGLEFLYESRGWGYVFDWGLIWLVCWYLFLFTIARPLLYSALASAVDFLQVAIALWQRFRFHAENAAYSVQKALEKSRR